MIGYLKGFLFTPERARTAIKHLSGGEVNRVLLAKLFTQTNNLMVLDEPTNDLDIEMLEVLEEKLVEYGGTLIVVSHDRDFVDNVVTSTLVFEENNRLIEYQGGFSDWASRGASAGGAGTAPGRKDRNHEDTAEPATAANPSLLSQANPLNPKRNSATSFSASSMRCLTPSPNSRPNRRADGTNQCRGFLRSKIFPNRTRTQPLGRLPRGTRHGNRTLD